MTEEAWWRKGITWVKRQYQVAFVRDFGSSAGVTIGVHVDDWERTMILRRRVLEILA